jgi:2'-5' RNA ligase
VTSERTRRGTAQHWRLFVALPVPEGAASSIAGALAPYRIAFPDARWLRPDLLHVTVRFLGTTDAAAVPELARAIGSVAAGADRSELATGPGAGNDPGRRGSGVAWLRLSNGASLVRQLSTRLDPLLPRDALASAALRPPPAAHVTVARNATGELIAALRDEVWGPTRVSWRPDRMVLYRSHTGTPAGSTYEPLAEARLGARAVA